MSYVDLAYYKFSYFGDGDDFEIPKALSRAYDDINLVICGPVNLDDYYEVQQTALKNAQCAQAEWYIENGYDYIGGSVESASLGSFSYKEDSADKSKVGVLSVRASQYLDMAGLNSRAVPVCGRNWADYED